MNLEGHIQSIAPLNLRPQSDVLRGIPRRETNVGLSVKENLVFLHCSVLGKNEDQTAEKKTYQNEMRFSLCKLQQGVLCQATLHSHPSVFVE